MLGHRAGVGSGPPRFHQGTPGLQDQWLAAPQEKPVVLARYAPDTEGFFLRVILSRLQAFQIATALTSNTTAISSNVASP